MSPRKSDQSQPKPAAGLSFAFPMRLPENGTGAGGSSKAPGKGWDRAKASTRQNLPRR